jgi:hypothetical protein
MPLRPEDGIINTSASSAGGEKRKTGKFGCRMDKLCQTIEGVRGAKDNCEVLA